MVPCKPHHIAGIQGLHWRGALAQGAPRKLEGLPRIGADRGQPRAAAVAALHGDAEAGPLQGVLRELVGLEKCSLEA